MDDPLFVVFWGLTQSCIPLLRYSPTKLWGYSGHIQTIIQSGISRLHCPLVNGRRYFIRATDGATVTYDLYQPIERHSSNGE